MSFISFLLRIYTNFWRQICYNKDSKFKEKVGEQILLILERLDDMGKPYLVANTFHAYIEGTIDYELFLRLASTIDRSFFPDLMAFKSSTDYNRLPSHTKLNLTSSGVLDLSAMPSIRMTANNNKYEVTDLGKTLLKVAFKT